MSCVSNNLLYSLPPVLQSSGWRSIVGSSRICPALDAWRSSMVSLSGGTLVLSLIQYCRSGCRLNTRSSVSSRSSRNGWRQSGAHLVSFWRHSALRRRLGCDSDCLSIARASIVTRLPRSYHRTSLRCNQVIRYLVLYWDSGIWNSIPVLGSCSIIAQPI